jgi:hypothetical protein
MTAAEIPHKIQCSTMQKCSDWARGGMIQDSIPGGHEIFSSKSFSPTLGSTQPPFHWALEAEQQGHELNCSHPSSAEVKSGWSRTSTSLCLYGVEKDCVDFYNS